MRGQVRRAEAPRRSGKWKMVKKRVVYFCSFFLNTPGGIAGRAGLGTGCVPGAIKVEQTKLSDPPEWAKGGNVFLVHCEPEIDGPMDPALHTLDEIRLTLDKNDALQERLFRLSPTSSQFSYTHTLIRSPWVEWILHNSVEGRNAIAKWTEGLFTLAKMGWPGPRISKILSDVYRFWGPTSYEKVWKEASKRQIKAAMSAFGNDRIIPIVRLRWHSSSAGGMGDVDFTPEVAIDTLFYLYDLCGCLAIHEGYIGATYLDWNTYPLAGLVVDFIAGMSREELTKKYVKPIKK